MQILTRYNKVIAYSSNNYIPVGSTAICAITGERYDDVLITNVDCVPTDIDMYEYYYVNGKFIKGCSNSEIRETNSYEKLRFWVGETTEFKESAPKEGFTVHIFTDDDTLEKIVKILNDEEQVPSATKVNNLEIKQDENGVLKIGDIIVPQKKLLYDNAVGFPIRSDSGMDTPHIDLGKSVAGKTIEIAIGRTIDGDTYLEYAKLKFRNNSFAGDNIILSQTSITEYSGEQSISNVFVSANAVDNGISFGYVNTLLKFTALSNTPTYTQIDTSDVTATNTYRIYKIYEIIE